MVKLANNEPDSYFGYVGGDDSLPADSPILRPVQPNIKPERSVLEDLHGNYDIVIDSGEGDLEIDLPWAFDIQGDDERVAKRYRELNDDRRQKRPHNGPSNTNNDMLPPPPPPTPGMTSSSVSGKEDHMRTENGSPGDRNLGLPLKPPRRNTQRRRLTLPLVLHTTNGPVRVSACPDTGSEDNVISLDLVRRLGLDVKALDDDARQFSLANGKVISAVGQTFLRYTFGVENNLDIISECIAYVFETLVVPIVTGAEFLSETKIFTHHRERLVEEVIPLMQSLRINSIGKPKQSLVCRLDTFVGCANADTGSDLDLITPQFARTRAMKIEPAREQLQFADGSIAYTSGFVEVAFSVGVLDAVKGFLQSGETLNGTFFILDSLTSDILVGQDTLEELRVFVEHGSSLLSCPPTLGLSDCNIIRHIGKFETKLSRFAAGVEKFFERTMKRSSSKEEPIPLSELLSGPTQLEENLTLIEMQRENARLETANTGHYNSHHPVQSDNSHKSEDGSAASAPSSATPLPLLTAEHFIKPNLPLLTSEHLIKPVPTYQCEFPGCTAPPFETQYLLQSHANVHSSARPHYCPVASCPRGTGGRGFKRMNEMIRHGLVHDSPGYLCPFCPPETGEDNKYPRPDNLQRHVRVHHVNVDKDDPLLREVLNQRPDGPNRGRRRRGNPSFTSP